MKSRANALKLRHSIELHCAGDPFTVKSHLKSLVSSALVPEDAKDDLQRFEQNGWIVKEGVYVPVRCLSFPAHRGVSPSPPLEVSLPPRPSSRH